MVPNTWSIINKYLLKGRINIHFNWHNIGKIWCISIWRNFEREIKEDQMLAVAPPSLLTLKSMKNWKIEIWGLFLSCTLKPGCAAWARPVNRCSILYFQWETTAVEGYRQRTYMQRLLVSRSELSNMGATSHNHLSSTWNEMCWPDKMQTGFVKMRTKTEKQKRTQSIAFKIVLY